MPDETKKENEQAGGAGTGTGADERSEEQKKEQEKKDQEAQAQKDKEETARLAKENAELKFDRDFEAMVAQYPNAVSFKDKIKERVSQGLPVDEATVLVLNKEKKLVTKQEIDRSNAGTDSAGGSGATQTPRGKKPANEMTTEELRKEFMELEAKGEINYTPD